MITVQLLGGASLRSDDSPLGGPPAQRHRIALLTLIVSAWPQPLSRDRALALLWPERGTRNARRLLNLSVHVLRSAFGEHAIVSAADGLLLNPASLLCDLHDLRAALAASAPEQVVQLYTGPLLDGFHLSESSEFGYWLDQQRDELSHAYLGALRAVAEKQEQAGDLHGAVGTCLRLVAADPYSGVYAQALMRALDAAGDRAGAIQHANEYARRLRADLDLEPDAAVVALGEQLRAAPARRAALPQQRQERSVAVLPFISLSDDPENECFAQGITEDVIAHLSKIRAIKVISRTSVMPFKERVSSLKEIGRALGATTLLDGSVRQSGDRVRIVAKLVDAETDRNLWAEIYDRQLTDIFSIQTDVALHIAGALKAELTADEQTRVCREPTRDLEAYRLFLQGRLWFSKFTPSALARSIELFERAIQHDPAFALAYAHIAMAHTELAETGVVAPEPAYARATAAAESALRLDPELAAAHCTIGFLKTVREFDWSGAERAFQRALELSPSDADSYSLYGRMCAALARYDEAIALGLRAHELDPLTHRMELATTLLRAGRYDEALVRVESLVELDPTHERVLATLGWAYFLSGRRDEGIAVLERAAAVSGNAAWLGQLGEAYGLAGRTEDARAVLAQLATQAQIRFVSPYHFAYVHTGLGEPDRALDYLERAVKERTGPAYGIRGSFLFAPLRPHPRFRALLEQLNLD
jgi:TolB-like protein/Tfp pilus assembly protein PilF